MVIHAKSLSAECAANKLPNCLVFYPQAGLTEKGIFCNWHKLCEAMLSLYLAWSLRETSGSRSRSGCSLHSGALAQTAQNPRSAPRTDQRGLILYFKYINKRKKRVVMLWNCVTWIRERMFAKWVSIAPPCGKFWFILFMSSVKQLKAMASDRRIERGSWSEKNRVGKLFSAVTSNTV